MRWVLYLSVLITLVTLVCCIVSICIPYWLYTKDPQLSYQGLWQRCTPVGTQGAGDNVNCELILLPPGKISCRNQKHCVISLCFIDKYFFNMFEIEDVVNIV